MARLAGRTPTPRHTLDCDEAVGAPCRGTSKQLRGSGLEREMEAGACCGRRGAVGSNALLEHPQPGPHNEHPDAIPLATASLIAPIRALQEEGAQVDRLLASSAVSMESLRSPGCARCRPLLAESHAGPIV